MEHVMIRSMRQKTSSVAALAALAVFIASGFLTAAPRNPDPAPQEKQASPGPLSAAHKSLDGAANCAKCHTTGKAIGSAQCLACHKTVAGRIAAKKGVHREVTGDCEACHVEHQGADVDLRPLDKAKFDHQEETGFALEGKHAALAATCERCHQTRSFMSLTPACQTCHKDPHQGAMKQPCASCHSPKTGFANASRSFHKVAAFPLEGRHLTVPCASCHLKGMVKGTPRRCYDCHWLRRQDDPYRTRLGNQCEDCHKPTAWTAVQWDHAARTGQAINAAMRTLNCDACHKNQMFRGSAPDCYSCHREDYQSTKNPNHASAGFPTLCVMCHSPGDPNFRQGAVNHLSIFPRVGVHATIECAACHKNNVYQGTPRDCYGCHRTNYEQTKNPNHVAAGFSTTCELCHRPTDTSFTQGTFNHTYFPTRMGNNICANCHTDATNFKIFTCVTCHSRSETDSKHRSIAGYVYNSVNCYSCHPQGK
jgi:hypothetical protein